MSAKMEAIETHKAPSYEGHFVQMMTQLQSAPKHLQLILSQLDRADAESLRCTCTTLRAIADKHHDVFQIPLIGSIKTGDLDSSVQRRHAPSLYVDATTKIDVRVGFWREPVFPGDRIVTTWTYTGTCSQLIPRLHKLLNGCIVINEFGISCYEDRGAQHLYHLVRFVADAVVLNKNCEFWLRDVGVYTAHAHQWRTLFTRLQLLGGHGIQRTQVLVDDGQGYVPYTMLDECYLSTRRTNVVLP